MCGEDVPFPKKKKSYEVTDHPQNTVFCAGISNPRNQDQLRWMMKKTVIPAMDNEGQNNHTDWLPSTFKICTSTEEYITGIVSSEEELKHLLESHKHASGTSYTVWYDDNHKKQKVTPQCLWQVEDYSEHVPLSEKKGDIFLSAWKELQDDTHNR